MNPEPARGKFGVNPSDPWSVKSNIAEGGGLDTYLKSKGINPKFISRDTKISHAKSSTYLKWKRDHKFEEVDHLDEDAMLDRYLKSRGINPKYVTKNQLIAHSKSGQFVKWKQDHMVESMSTQPTPYEMRHQALRKAAQSNRVVKKSDVKTDKLRKEENELDESALEKFRKDSAEREKKHDEIEKKRQSDTAKGKEHMSSAIDRLEKHLNKENTLDPLAATENPVDGASCTDDALDKKRQMSKSARMIKSLYKKHNMKEDTYDWEKDDKNQTSPGKKNPKMFKADPKANYGDAKPDARAVLSGGTTLTGEPRDTIEIDPLMKNRPDLNGNVKDDAGNKKNNKINN